MSEIVISNLKDIDLVAITKFDLYKRRDSPHMPVLPQLVIRKKGFETMADSNYYYY